MTAHIYQKRGNWYAVLIYQTAQGERKQKWVDTGLQVRGNKRKAASMLETVKAKWQPILEPAEDAGIQPQDVVSVQTAVKQETQQEAKANDILFSDYLLAWLECKREKVQITTFGGYQRDIQGYVAPYFAKRKIYLSKLTEQDIVDFYQFKRREGVSDSTLLHYQTLMNQALCKAARERLILVNPLSIIDKDQKPKKEKFIPTVYNEQDVSRLFSAIKNDPLALVILLDVTYGLRRSEVLGLRWQAIDFETKTIQVSYKVTEMRVDGHMRLIMSEQMKNASSNRTLPLVPIVEKELLRHREQQAENRRLYKKSYCKKYEDFVFVNEQGQLIQPGYVTQHFRSLLKKHGLKKIRFHDLRHTCATMLRRKKISLHEIQLWLGHSTYQTTADLYTHLDFVDKMDTANAAAQIVAETF